jgi:hypothetical protein
MEVSPRGLVSGLKLHGFVPPHALSESAIILEYSEECAIMMAYCSSACLCVKQPRR